MGPFWLLSVQLEAGEASVSTGHTFKFESLALTLKPERAGCCERVGGCESSGGGGEGANGSDSGVGIVEASRCRLLPLFLTVAATVSIDVDWSAVRLSSCCSSSMLVCLFERADL